MDWVGCGGCRVDVDTDVSMFPHTLLRRPLMDGCEESAYMEPGIP